MCEKKTDPGEYGLILAHILVHGRNGVRLALRSYWLKPFDKEFNVVYIRAAKPYIWLSET
jgi:hypothetical protein